MATAQPGEPHAQAGREPLVNKYLRAAVKTKANDLHLKVGQPARLRLQGNLKSATGDVLTSEQMEEMVFEILSPDQKARFLQHGTLDFAYEYEPGSRFRVNVFRQRGHISLAARRVNSTVPSFEALHLPPILAKIAESSEGLVLVVGPTGCGKTTTIAAMLDFIARTRACHIVTIEDPIEYLYHDGKAIVSQREIGLDVPNYEEALTYLMRQDPDVVLVGEMRDAQTVTAGMRAAETGHLVFGTLHTQNASKTVDRIIDIFPANQQAQIRATLSDTLKAVVAQTLFKRIDVKGRCAALEILIVTPAVANLIREGKTYQLPGVIQTSKKFGMTTLEDSIMDLLKKRWISPEEAYDKAVDKSKFVPFLPKPPEEMGLA